ncbi:MAG: thermonuclease family protein, partial [Kiloniellales bacterium]|nr:thermonuclease family protein [Kiloniellales bacterium]
MIKLLSAAGLVTLCLTLSLQATKAGDALRGMPRVIDGNTIELDGQRLRLHGIDAPELGQVCELRGKPYDCGEISRAALLDLTAGTPILCRPIESESGT